MGVALQDPQLFLGANGAVQSERMGARVAMAVHHHRVSVEKEEMAWDGPSGECVWNGMALGALKADALTFDAECALLAEMDCLAKKENCAWVGFQHFGARSNERVESELSVGGLNVRALLDMKVSTMDILLGAAVVITAAFALHQMCRWMGARQSAKGWTRFDDETPLLETV